MREGMREGMSEGRIKTLSYKPKVGGAIELINAPIDMGISLLFFSLSPEDRAKCLDEITSKHIELIGGGK